MTHMGVGLSIVLERIEELYETNAMGRLIGHSRDGGSPQLSSGVPRFVLGRAIEGCLWRFSTSLEESRLRAISRLAGREPGFAVDPDGRNKTEPERLFMISRLLSENGRSGDRGEAAAVARHIFVARDDRFVGELWTFD